ncbi:MAG: hypothetical protein KJO55_02655, partial [Gammaproteobacteria bacterium]|nr:hypothetical protein [Gammaproteobacteria bacterium]
LVPAAIAVAFGALATDTAESVAIYLTPSTQIAEVDQEITVEVWWDFSDEPTLGGANDIYFDTSRLRFESWTHSGAGQPDFASNPNILEGHLEAFGAGTLDFNNCIGGPVLVGTIVFTALVAGETPVIITENDSNPMSSCVTFNPYLDIDIGSATVTIDSDSDFDGVIDSQDNCIDIDNNDQRDTDGDGHGNICDADFDNSCLVNFNDLSIMADGFFGSDPELDLDSNGIVNFADLSILADRFFQAPGPSALGSLCNPFPTFEIGDTGPGGGIVFYLEPGSDGTHGLLAADSDLSASHPWGCFGSNTGATDTDIGTGLTNTQTIISNACSNSDTAAELAGNNPASGWFLPSRNELDLMHENLHSQGLGGFADEVYWSSSEATANNAWSQIFGNGLIIQNNKTTLRRVRAIRAF